MGNAGAFMEELATEVHAACVFYKNVEAGVVVGRLNRERGLI